MKSEAKFIEHIYHQMKSSSSKRKLGGKQNLQTQYKKYKQRGDTLTAAADRWDEIFSGFQNKHTLHEYTHLHTNIVMVQQKMKNGVENRGGEKNLKMAIH